MTRKQRRLTIIAAAGVLLSAAVALMLVAFQDSVVFFNSPSEVAERGVAPGERFRLGGLVAENSVVRSEGVDVRFVVTDTVEDVEVVYGGLLPDLFREGQGVVAEGALDGDGLFVADTVLARHDENYMPREVADALKAQGHWMNGENESYGGEDAQAEEGGG